MKESTRKNKTSNGYLWWNLLAMAVVCLLLFLGVKYGLNFYTHHGEAIAVPDVKHKSSEVAFTAIKDANLTAIVTDTGYVKTLPPGMRARTDTRGWQPCEVGTCGTTGAQRVECTDA